MKSFTAYLYGFRNYRAFSTKSTDTSVTADYIYKKNKKLYN